MTIKIKMRGREVVVVRICTRRWGGKVTTLTFNT